MDEDTRERTRAAYRARRLRQITDLEETALHMINLFRHQVPGREWIGVEDYAWAVRELTV